MKDGSSEWRVTVSMTDGHYLLWYSSSSTSAWKVIRVVKQLNSENLAGFSNAIYYTVSLNGVGEISIFPSAFSDCTCFNIIFCVRLTFWVPTAWPHHALQTLQESHLSKSDAYFSTSGELVKLQIQFDHIFFQIAFRIEGLTSSHNLALDLSYLSISFRSYLKISCQINMPRSKLSHPGTMARTKSHSWKYILPSYDQCFGTLTKPCNTLLEILCLVLCLLAEGKMSVNHSL